MKKIFHLDPDQLQAYFDQELDQESVKSIQTHLKACERCQSELDRLMLIASRLEALPEIPLEKNLSGAVLKQLKNRPKFSLGLTWTLVLEAVAAGIMVGFIIPVMKAAAWLPGVLNTPGEFLAAVNIFLTQLASSWMIWAAQIQLTISRYISFQQIPLNFPAQLPSPWLIILSTGSLVALINYFLLRQQPIRNGNHNH